MRLIVEVRVGPLAGEKAVVEPGGSLRVGQSGLAGLVIPDSQMAGLHFKLDWDGAKCALTALGNERATLHNGEEVAAAQVESGDWIKAGETLVSVYFEGATPPRREDRALLSQRAAEKEKALAALRAEREPLYAVLDAARSYRVLELLRESVEPYRSLYEGAQGEALAEAAPYLVRLPSGSPLLERLVREGWSRSFCIFLTCRRPFNEVRRHLRRFLMVQEEGKSEALYFRFYDPRVLRDFLPTCTVRQAADFFGEIGCMLAEGEEGEVLRFTAAGARSAGRGEK